MRHILLSAIIGALAGWSIPLLVHAGITYF
jgi:hypothetical protein